MNAFAGIVEFDGLTDQHGIEARIGNAFGRAQRGRLEVRRDDHALFIRRAGPAAQSVRHPDAEPDGGDLFCGDCRLDNRRELADALAIAPAQLAQTSDGMILQRAYRRWGDAGLARCCGAFAFALWQPDTRRLMLARDCLGNRSLFLYRERDRLTFASSLGLLFALPHVPREIDEIILARFLVSDLGEPRRTFYRGVERVPSRSLVTVDRAGVSHRHYWSPDFDAPPPYRRDEDYIERARELFDRAVAAATAGTRHVAVSASGGLDSSAIAATVARLGRAERMTCYSLVPPRDTAIDVGPTRYLDERDKLEALARMYPALELRFITDETPHPFEHDATRLFARSNVPILGPSQLGPFAGIRDAAAAAGHTAILMGNAGNFGLTWDGPFSLSVLFRNREWTTFTRDLIAVARDRRHSLPRTFAGEVVMAAAPQSVVRLVHRLRHRDRHDVTGFSALNPTFVAGHAFLRWRWSETHKLTGRNRANRAPSRLRAYYLFDHNQFIRDVAAESGSVFGCERRDPHADRKLLQFLLAVPEPMYRRNGIPRSFARAVFADRLPREILDERRRGAQAVNWFGRLSARRPDIEGQLERLEASPLASRLLDVPRLKRLVARWPKDADEAERRRNEYKVMLSRSLHVGQFIRWVEGGNG